MERKITSPAESFGKAQSEFHPSDAELLDQFQSGNRPAATLLYRRYASRLLRLAQAHSGNGLSQRLEAEDVVQSVFRTFFRRAAVGHYTLPKGEELWKLFLVISLNKIRKKSVFHHAARRNVHRTQAIGDYQLGTCDQAVQILEWTIDELIQQLPEAHRGVIRDRIAGFEVGEMTQRNHLSRRTIERVLQNFREKLRSELREIDGSEL